MIIIGYPGIGKTTLAGLYYNNTYIIEHTGYKGIIDLESSCFHAIRGNFVFDMYCRVAEDLSRQGFVVFVSAHEDVQRELRKTKEHVIVCYPALHLREEWIKKLRERYTTSILMFDSTTKCETHEEEKNFKAYNRACNYYEDDIKFMSGNGFDSIVIEDMFYSLKDLIFGKEEKK